MLKWSSYSPLLLFSMDGVGQHQTTALAEEDQHLLPLLLLSVVVALGTLHQQDRQLVITAY